MAKQHLYLVDGSGYIFRAYHRLPPLTDPTARWSTRSMASPTMLWKLIEELNKAEAPTHLAVIFDAGSHTFRNEMYAGYKAHRPPPPDDLVPQFPLIRDAVRAFSRAVHRAGRRSRPTTSSPAMPRRRCAAGFDVSIVSSDKDLMQLVQPGLDLYDTMKNCRINREDVIEKFGVAARAARRGARADGRRGRQRPRRPRRRAEGRGRADPAVRHASTRCWRGSTRSRSPSCARCSPRQADMARLSRELVRLKDDLPLAVPLDDLTLREPPQAPLAAFLAKHGFRSLLPKLGREVEAAHAPAPADDAPPVPFDHKAYECVTTLDRLDWWIAEATRRGVVAVDSRDDRSRPDPRRARRAEPRARARPRLLCPAGAQGRRGAARRAGRPARRRDASSPGSSPLFADPAVLKIGQNLKYDMIVFAPPRRAARSRRTTTRC